MKQFCFLFLSLLAIQTSADQASNQSSQDLESTMREDLYEIASCMPEFAIPVLGNTAGYLLGQWIHAQFVNSDLEVRYVKPLIEDVMRLAKEKRSLDSELFKNFKLQMSEEPEVKECSIELRNQFFDSFAAYLEALHGE